MDGLYFCQLKLHFHIGKIQLNASQTFYPAHWQGYFLFYYFGFCGNHLHLLMSNSQSYFFVFLYGIKRIKHWVIKIDIGCSVSNKFAINRFRFHIQSNINTIAGRKAFKTKSFSSSRNNRVTKTWWNWPKTGAYHFCDGTPTFCSDIWIR
ncbi:hypothetical protein D3C80_1581090 [compost metagenome]